MGNPNTAEGASSNPISIIQLLDSDVSAERLKQEIEKNNSLAHQVIELANSAGNGLSYQIERVEHAIAILGRRNLRMLVSKQIRQDSKHQALNKKPTQPNAFTRGQKSQK